MRIITIFLMSVLAASVLNAQNNPVAFKSDARIKQVSYKENDVIPIQGMTLTTTQIVFGEQEQILDVEGGDSAAWMVTVHPSLPHMMFVKPTVLNSDSNMTVITNRHHYYFHMTSNQHLERNPTLQTYAVKVVYDDQPKNKSDIPAHPHHPVEAANKKLNWNYRFSGNPQLLPLHVYDDGQFTYFELAANAPVPAIFAVEDKQGKEMTVNTRREGKYIVVQRTAPQFTLRQGSMVTSVFNTLEIYRIQQNKRPTS